ncbi:MAG: nucleoside deaminase [Patescibacteria group bacterium]|nr:nucleoside deaminase [Patescibacteria group bacterium]
MHHPQKEFMEVAIKEAIRSAKKGQYALGAVVVLNDKVISIAHTTLHKIPDSSGHAEMNAIRKACKKLGSRYLEGAWLYTVQEPCLMCASVAVWAKMEGVVFGAFEKDALKIFNKHVRSRFTWRQIMISAKEVLSKSDPKVKLYEGFMRDECIELYKLNK